MDRDSSAITPSSGTNAELATRRGTMQAFDFGDPDGNVLEARGYA